MRDRSIDEFESLFERASIPVLDIREVPLRSISVVLDGRGLDAAVRDLAHYLAARFAAQLHVHTADPAAATLDQAASAEPFGSPAELVGQVSIAGSQLLLLPMPSHGAIGDEALDKLILGTAPPVLVVRSAVPDPAAVFARVLHSLTGNFKQTENFACSFTLVADGGGVLLLHTIDEHDVGAVRETLQASPEVAIQDGQAVLEALAHHGERYLKAVVASQRDEAYDVQYRVVVGDVVDCVRSELEAGDYSLLVVGTHEHGRSAVSAADYQLLHRVRDIPVLAL